MAKFGLIGKDIDYSFSRSYFNEKFKSEGLKHTYVNFDIDTIDAFPEILKSVSIFKSTTKVFPI